MFVKKRTPLIALAIAAVIAVLTVLIFQKAARPFTVPQLVLLYITSYLPAFGIAMLFDPKPRAARAEFLKINFYAETPEERIRK